MVPLFNLNKPISKPFYPNTLQFGGEANPTGKTKATPEERAAFEKANALAKQVRPLLPVALQLAFPVPEHRQGVVAAHIKQMLAGLKALIPNADNSGLVGTIQAFSENPLPDARKSLDATETLSDDIFQHVTKPHQTNLEREQQIQLVLPNIPNGPTFDRQAELLLVDVGRKSDEASPVDASLINRVESTALKKRLLSQQLLTFENRDPLTYTDPLVQEWFKTVETLPDQKERVALKSQFLELYMKTSSPYNATFLESEMLSIQQRIQKEDETYNPASVLTDPMQQFSSQSQFASSLYQNILTSELPESAFAKIKDAITNLSYLPSLEEAEVLVKKLKTTARIRSLIQSTSTTKPSSTMAVNRMVLSIQNKGIREGLFAAALIKTLQSVNEGSSDSVLLDLGLQLQKLPGRGVEKQLFIQSVFNSEESLASPHLVQVTTHLLFDGLSDTAKASTIIGMTQTSIDDYVLTIAKAAVFTLKDKVLRNSLLGLFSEDTDKKALDKIDKLDSLRRDPNTADYFKVIEKAYEPSLSLGLDLNATIKPTLRILQHAQLDAGVLNRDVLPDFSKLLAHTIKHADKLVKAGQTVPTPTDIEQRFRNNKDAGAILAGIILLGRPAMEMAVERKRLDNVLDSVKILLEEPDTFSLLVTLKQKAVSQFDMLKIAEMSEIFINQTSTKSLVKTLKDMAEKPKLDLAPLAKATLEEVMKKVNVSVENIDPAQFEKWNLKHINTLVKAFSNTNDKATLTEVCRAALQGKFHEYLYDPNTELGKANLATKAAFEAEGLNFDLWQNYTEVQKITMPSKVQYARELEQTILAEYLRLPAETMTRFQEALAHAGYSITEDPESHILSIYSNRYQSKVEDSQIVSVLNQLIEDSSIKRAFSSASVKKMKAMNATIKNRLPQSPEPLEIAVWDRNPGFDMFMGTDTGACTAIDNGNLSSIHALQNTFVQMVHLRKPGEKQSVGKILLFWSKNPETGSLICHWNTFEGRGGAGSMYEHNYFMREQLLAFVEKYAKAVSGKSEVPIRTCDTYNPTYKEDLDIEFKTCQVIGKMKPGSRYYLDTFSGGEVDISKTFKDTKLWKMNAVEISVPETPKPPTPPSPESDNPVTDRNKEKQRPSNPLPISNRTEAVADAMLAPHPVTLNQTGLLDSYHLDHFFSSYKPKKEDFPQKQSFKERYIKYIPTSSETIESQNIPNDSFNQILLNHPPIKFPDIDSTQSPPTPTFKPPEAVTLKRILWENIDPQKLQEFMAYLASIELKQSQFPTKP